MAQGYPVSEEEQRKIWELHQIGYFPSVIARHLSDRYAHLNGGFRSVETVKDTIKMMEKQKENPVVSPSDKDESTTMKDDSIPKKKEGKKKK